MVTIVIIYNDIVIALFVITLKRVFLVFLYRVIVGNCVSNGISPLLEAIFMKIPVVFQNRHLHVG